MKASGKVAKRYARALFELCAPQDFDSVLKSLIEVSDLVHGNRELSVALTNPAISLKDRTAIITDVVKLSSPQPVLSNFLTRILENSRLGTLPQICLVLAQLIDSYKKVKSLEIISAAPIQSDEREAILSQIQRDFGADARISWEVDPTLIGGLRVKAGDVLLDGSVRSRLERIRAVLVQ